MAKIDIFNRIMKLDDFSKKIKIEHTQNNPKIINLDAIPKINLRIVAREVVSIGRAVYPKKPPDPLVIDQIVKNIKTEIKDNKITIPIKEKNIPSFESVIFDAEKKVLTIIGKNLNFIDFSKNSLRVQNDKNDKSFYEFFGNISDDLIKIFPNKIEINAADNSLKFLQYNTKKGLIEFKSAENNSIKNFEINNGIDPYIDFVLSSNEFDETSNDFTIKDKKLPITTTSRICTNILSNMFSETIELSPIKNVSNKKIEDTLRAKGGKYWTNRRLEINSTNMKSLDYGVRGAPYFFRYYKNTLILNQTGSEQWVSIKANRANFTLKKKYSSELWNKFIFGGTFNNSGKKIEYSQIINTGSVFRDLSCDIQVPYSETEEKRLNIPFKTLTYKVEPNYNFYVKNYEELIAKQEVDEKSIPNMYVFVSEQKSEEPNENFKNLINLNGAIESYPNFTNKSKQKFDIKTNAFGEYYDLYTNYYPQAVSTASKKAEFNKLLNKYKNILLSQKEVDLIQEYNDKKEVFPMFVEMNFSTDKTTNFAQILKDTKINDAFMTNLVNKIVNNTFESIPLTEKKDEINLTDSQSPPKKTFTLDNKTKKTWKVYDLLSEIKANDQSLNEEFSIFLGEYKNEESKYDAPEYKFFKNLMFSIADSKIKKLIKTYIRTYKDLISGKKSYNETVLYRIAKFAGTNTNQQPIQNYYFSNSNDLDVLNFIDTQVKYNKEYTYVVYAYQFVLSTEYRYSNVISDLESNVAFKVSTNEVPQIIEQEYFKYTAKIYDTPPIPPEISFVPYKGIDDKMLILLNSSVGAFVSQPIAINNSDNKTITEIRNSQKRFPEEPIKFQSDDYVSQYEIYRMEKLPKNYSEFKDFLRAQVTCDVSQISKQSATSAGFIDTLVPNRKYYYTFRSIDNHSHFSNPTQVFEVQIVNENGMIYPIITSVDFADIPKTNTKEARRFIQITPNILQTLINEEKSGYSKAKTSSDINNIILGNIDESLWGKDFVIKVTSKSTGKKIDFRIKFDVKRQKSS